VRELYVYGGCYISESEFVFIGSSKRNITEVNHEVSNTMSRILRLTKDLPALIIDELNTYQYS